MVDRPRRRGSGVVHLPVGAILGCHGSSPSFRFPCYPSGYRTQRLSWRSVRAAIGPIPRWGSRRPLGRPMADSKRFPPAAERYEPISAATSTSRALWFASASREGIAAGEMGREGIGFCRWADHRFARCWQRTRQVNDDRSIDLITKLLCDSGESGDQAGTEFSNWLLEIKLRRISPLSSHDMPPFH